jgi:hypothetical protein
MMDELITLTMKMSPNNKRLYNLNNLYLIQKEGDAFIESMVKIFISTMPNYLQDLTEAAKSNDLKKVYFCAHKMKSSVDLLNIAVVKKDLLNLEEYAKNAVKVNEILPIAQKVADTLNKAMEEMREDFNWQ